MTLELQIEEEFLSKLYALDTQDEFYKARKSSLEIKKKELDAVFLMKKPRQKNIKKFNKDIDQKEQDKEKCPKTKSSIELDLNLACSVKSIAMKKCRCKTHHGILHWKNANVFKISLDSFAYDFTKTFFFSNKKTREIYNKYMIELVFPYSILTDSESTCVFFIFICKLESDLPDSKFRDVFFFFEVIVQNEIFYRFDTFHNILGKLLCQEQISQKNLVILA